MLAETTYSSIRPSTMSPDVVSNDPIWRPQLECFTSHPLSPVEIKSGWMSGDTIWPIRHQNLSRNVPGMNGYSDCFSATAKSGQVSCLVCDGGRMSRCVSTSYRIACRGDEPLMCHPYFVTKSSFLSAITILNSLPSLKLANFTYVEG